MSCCGKSSMIMPRRGSRTRGKIFAADVYFRYVGKSSLAAVGPVTGRQYQFNGHGARLLVDRRDAPSFMGVPNLRLLRV